MKKRKIAAVFTAIGAAFNLSGCFNPFANEPQCVYGPPPAEDTVFNPANNEMPDVYGPPEYFESEAEYNPADNEMPAVYGPPEYFDETEAEVPAAPVLPVKPDYNPAETTAVPIYGPPEAFENADTDNPTETVYVPELPKPAVTSKGGKLSETTAMQSSIYEVFEPSLNEMEDVYGPPEWWGGRDSDSDILEPSFDPELNEEPCVYGPPEWFESEREEAEEQTDETE